jgi:NTP pyrophosphatase (non-canonical NTP hydrolase)
MIEYIREQLSQEELLCQLAEEASELAQAALKLRRVYDGSNPTPIKRSEAFDNLKEEIADVELVLMVLGYDRSMLISEKYKRMDAKLIRWANRLKERENNEK